MRAGSDPASFERAITRLPQWVLALSALGTGVTGCFLGLAAAGGFLTGALGAWVNLKVIERAARRLGRHAGEKPGKGPGVWVFIQFTCLVSGAFVILSYSGFSLPAAFCGFLVCPVAVVLEIVYELVTLNFKK